MKWIKSRRSYISEAKLKDILLEPQKRRIKTVWGEKWLEYEEITPTKKITQGKWKLSKEDSSLAINTFFKTDIEWIKNKLDSLPERFTKTVNLCIGLSNRSLGSQEKETMSKIFENFNIRRPSIPQMKYLDVNYTFSLINSGETRGDSRVEKDERGRPLLNQDGSIKKIAKEPGELVLGGNFGNLQTFITSYNNAYPEDYVDAAIFRDSNFRNLINMINETTSTDFDMFGEHDIYLLIKHNAIDILNMSMSKFYNSCQELYFGGGHGTRYMKQLLINVFDPNTMPAFLVFDTPYYTVTGTSDKEDSLEKVSDAMPLCRSLLRNIEPFTDDKKTFTFFDKTYPDRMARTLKKIVEDYSGNKVVDVNDIPDNTYYYLAPDIDSIDTQDLSDPYMDHLSVKRGLTIGKNTKAIYLSRSYDWSKTVISSETSVKELIIETSDIPSNFFEIKMKLEWVKFKYIKINDFSKFKNILTDSISIYQCKLNPEFISQLHQISPNLKKLALGSVEISDLDNLRQFKNLEELELTYTLSSKSNIESVLEGTNLKKLTLSGDMVKNPENMEYVNKLRKSGIKVDLKGLVL